MMNGHNPLSQDDELRALAADGPPADPPDDALDALLAADADSWRATLPPVERFAERMVGVLRGAELPASTEQGAVAVEDDEQDDVTLIREPLDGPRGERRRPALPSRVARLGGRGRGLLAVGAMAAVVAVLVVVIQVLAPLRAGYLPATPTEVVTAEPPITLPGGAWQQITLPFAETPEGGYAVSPIDPATIYACFSEGVPDTGGQLIVGTLSAWVTHDTGRHWSTLDLPPLNGAGCQITVARGDPGHVGVLVWGAGNARQACDNDSIYLSDDGGAHWRAIPYQPASPNGVSNSGCLLILTSDAVYVDSSWLTGDPGSGGVQLSAWQRTTDGGHTWQRLDTAFGAQTFFDTWEVGTGDSFIACTIPTPGNPDHALWITHDGGTHWQRLGALPPNTDTFAFPAPTAGLNTADATHPFYALQGEQVPSQFFHLAVYASGDGRTWTHLPPLPVQGATEQRTGMTQALGVDAAGRFYTLGVGPTSEVPPQGAPQQPQQQPDLRRQWLWVWDPRVARWQQFPTPLAAPWPTDCGVPCWSGAISAGPAGATYVWLGDLGSDSTGIHLYRVRVG